MENSLISNQAKIAKSVVIGPYSIIEGDVQIGPGTIIGSYVSIKSGTKIGKNNIIASGCQIGVEPQDYHFNGESSQCIIGNNNRLREYVTISRATGKDNKTVIGSHNFIMTYVHIAHNARLSNNTVISSGAQLGGWVEIGDSANIGGLSGIHQFCRVGRYAMLGAKSYLNKDLAPYLLARGNRAKIYGINEEGLRRHQFNWQEIEQIKSIFRIMYNSAYSLTEIPEILKSECNKNKYIDEMIKFIKTTNRGILLKVIAPLP